MAKDDTFFKPRSMDEAVAFLEHKRGRDVFMTRERMRSIERVPTGFYEFDKVVGGGVPVGRIIELYGLEGSGKTTFALELVKVFQARPEKNLVLYLDYEHAMDFDYAEQIGVRMDDAVWRFVQPFSLEQGIDVLGVLAYTGKVGLVVVDSVAGMTPEEELAGEMSKHTMGAQARGIGKAMRKLTGVLSKTGTTCVFINQVRDKIGVLFGSPETTPGGKALKFYSAVRIRMSSKKSDVYEDGILSKFSILKNKTSVDQRGRCEYHLVPGKGYMVGLEAFEIGLDLGVITKDGKKVFKIGKGNGMEKEDMIEMLNRRPDIRGIIYRKLRGKTNE